MKTVLITGVGRGIGLASAKEFISRDFFVIGTTKDGIAPEQLNAIDSARLKTFKLDLSTSASIDECAEAIRKDAEGKGIDILVNNAGVLRDEDNTRLIVDKLRQTLEVNLIGTADFTEKIVPILNEKAHIVNISSMAGSLSDSDEGTTSHFPYHYPAYKISKCALNMYTRTLAMSLTHEDSRGIIVSSIHPGWVRTNIGGDEAPDSPEEAARQIADLSLSTPPSGYFWYNGEKAAW